MTTEGRVGSRPKGFLNKKKLAAAAVKDTTLATEKPTTV